jgi:SAM-dependent methyltransferase
VSADPAFLDWKHATRFQEPDVAARYHLRPRYPVETFTILADLAGRAPRAVLDAGTGTGEIARGLLPFVERVDAVDASPAMIAAGRRRPGGTDRRLSWITGPVESVDLRPPYALIVTGDSLHWMDWDVVLPRFAAVLDRDRFLAIAHRDVVPPPWSAELAALIDRFSTSPPHRRLNLIGELETRGLFRQIGTCPTGPAGFEQPVDDYVAHFHSMSRLTLQGLGTERAAAFAAEVRALVRPYARDGRLSLRVVGSVAWGRPLKT